MKVYQKLLLCCCLVSSVNYATAFAQSEETAIQNEETTVQTEEATAQLEASVSDRRDPSWFARIFTPKKTRMRHQIDSLLRLTDSLQNQLAISNSEL